MRSHGSLLPATRARKGRDSRGDKSSIDDEAESCDHSNRERWRANSGSGGPRGELASSSVMRWIGAATGAIATMLGAITGVASNETDGMSRLGASRPSSSVTEQQHEDRISVLAPGRS